MKKATCNRRKTPHPHNPDNYDNKKLLEKKGVEATKRRMRKVVRGHFTGPLRWTPEEQ